MCVVTTVEVIPIVSRLNPIENAKALVIGLALVALFILLRWLLS